MTIQRYVTYEKKKKKKQQRYEYAWSKSLIHRNGERENVDLANNERLFGMKAKKKDRASSNSKKKYGKCSQTLTMTTEAIASTTDCMNMISKKEYTLNIVN